MHTVSAVIAERLGHKARVNAVSLGDRLYSRLEAEESISRLQSRRCVEVYLVLTAAALVARGYRVDTHLLESEAYVAAYILALVVGSDIAEPA